MDGVKRSGVCFSVIILSWNTCPITRSRTIQKNHWPISQILRFSDIESGLCETERLKNLKKSVKIRSQSQKVVKFVIFGPMNFRNFARTCDSTDVSASNYDRKMDARLFDTIHDISRCLRLVQWLLKERNTPIWRIGNRRVKPSAPDSLICVDSRLRQIGAFRPLRRDCTRLRHRRMSWIM